MSYPPQPSYTPPYGQPPTPQRQNNLWLVGGATVVVLAIIMTVTLILVQRSNSTDSGSGGDPATTTEAEPTAEPEPTEETEPTDDGGGGEAAGFTEATCDAFDQTKFTAIFGAAPDPDDSYTSATSSGDGGSLSCSYAVGYDSATVSVSSWGDADSAMEWWQGDKEYWLENPEYKITDYTDLGDAGYHMIYGEGDTYQKRAINVVMGALQIKVEIWIYPDEQDVAVADDYLQDMGEQAAEMFADYT